jgi:hypothetical protein
MLGHERRCEVVDVVAEVAIKHALLLRCTSRRRERNYPPVLGRRVRRQRERESVCETTESVKEDKSGGEGNLWCVRGNNAALIRLKCIYNF